MATMFSTGMEMPLWNYPYVRITHTQSGISVGPVGGESKSTYRTREHAMRILRSRLVFGDFQLSENVYTYRYIDDKLVRDNAV